MVLYLALFGQFPFHDRDASCLEAMAKRPRWALGQVMICQEDHETGLQAGETPIAGRRDTRDRVIATIIAIVSRLRSIGGDAGDPAGPF